MIRSFVNNDIKRDVPMQRIDPRTHTYSNVFIFKEFEFLKMVDEHMQRNWSLLRGLVIGERRISLLSKRQDIDVEVIGHVTWIRDAL